jgi:hypothetical protein
MKNEEKKELKAVNKRLRKNLEEAYHKQIDLLSQIKKLIDEKGLLKATLKAVL